MAFCNLIPATTLLRLKLSALQSISLEKPKPKLPSYFSSGKWLLRCSLSPSTSSSVPSFCCRASMAEAPAELLTLRDICGGKVPEHILKRAEEIGYVMPTDVQRQSLPVLLCGQDCVLHAQTGSGKTLAYLLLIYSVIKFQRSAVQALIVVPTRELGMQVTKIARVLAAKSVESDNIPRNYTVMSLLDGGMLRRHKTWLKAEPPDIVVATIGSLIQMLERNVFKLEAVRVLVVDEVDFMFNSSKQVYSLRKLLTTHSSIERRQTVFASASIPQHNRFIYDCVQHKWTKNDVVHIHVNPIEPMPSHLHHRFVICGKKERLSVLLHLLLKDAPRSGIIFVSEQSEKSKKAGKPPSATLLVDFLKASYDGDLDTILFEEDMNFNARATLLSDIRQRGFLLVATDLASRGFDLPQITHIYNFDLPRTAVDYLHRSGRTARLPFSTDRCFVTSFITSEEQFVLQRFQNELLFQCEELVLDSFAL
ncbi:DEAD-box ATP-dependent RNA helicase 58, chloroplastic isoform X1 [Phalaenopsis equestris]|uniref:DEAD-box ATP-dependent RNA helicase 58, chloroplastic isoform X1 n=2 Tax=Phalaenopsis equestris TaxID=78828 RepID=UPI0009E1EAB0|nr:DEAD-box ATP-dependent RNA helicase 58, chloroplastic isoform X1 [Phalaenopsis equestris]